MAYKCKLMRIFPNERIMISIKCLSDGQCIIVERNAKMQKINACRPRWHFPWTKLDCQIGTGWQMYILVGQSMHILCLYASQPTFETLQINDYIPQCPFSNVSNIFNQLSFFDIWCSYLVNGFTFLKICIYNILY